MKLFRITQDYNTGYDTFDSAIVAAESEADAKRVHPHDGSPYDKTFKTKIGWASDSWAEHPTQVRACLIGEATPDTQPGVVLASYNAA